MKTNYKPVIYLTIVLLIFYCSALFILIPIYMFNIDINNCSDAVYNTLRVVPNIAEALLLIILYRNTLKKDFIDFKNNFGNYSDIALKYWILGFLAMMISNFTINLFSPVEMAANEQGVREIISAVPIVSLFSICLMAPIAEELTFRKSFKDCFSSKWLFILISGIVFGFLHVIGSFGSLYELLYIIPYSALGIAFASAYYKTNNIFVSIFIHCMHNTILVLLNILLSGVILLWMNQELKKIMI